MKAQYSPKLVLAVSILLLAQSLMTEVTLKKKYEIPLPTGTSAIFPLGNEEVLLWSRKQQIIQFYKQTKLIDTFSISPGEGPGDLNNLGNIIKKNNKFFVWDKTIRRLSIFSLRFEIEKSYRLPKMGILANLMGIMDGQYIYEWAQTKRTRQGHLFTRMVGTVDSTGKMICYHSLAGRFSIIKKGKRRHNLDKGILVSTHDNLNIYFADNRQYKIYKIKIDDPDRKPKLFIERKFKKTKCIQAYTDLQHHLWTKPPVDENWYEIYPKYLPPVYLIAADPASDYFMVVRNSPTLIKEKRAEIDIFSKGGIFKGTCKTPITMNHWVVFPAEFYFKDSIILMENLLYLYLDEQVAVYHIADYHSSHLPNGER